MNLTVNLVCQGCDKEFKFHWNLDADAKCPHCGAVNILDWEYPENDSMPICVQTCDLKGVYSG